MRGEKAEWHEEGDDWENDFDFMGPKGRSQAGGHFKMRAQ